MTFCSNRRRMIVNFTIIHYGLLSTQTIQIIFCVCHLRSSYFFYDYFESNSSHFHNKTSQRNPLIYSINSFSMLSVQFSTFFVENFFFFLSNFRTNLQLSSFWTNLVYYFSLFSKKKLFSLEFFFFKETQMQRESVNFCSVAKF